jgi:hypothetical protein
MTVLLFFLLSGCADLNGGIGDPDCFRGPWGCVADQVINITIRLTDADGSPISDAKLVCQDASGLLGTTNADGLINLSVAGVGTSTGVFYPYCEIAYVYRKDGSYGSPFWFRQFVRGEEVHTGDVRVELVTDSGTTSD